MPLNIPDISPERGPFDGAYALFGRRNPRRQGDRRVLSQMARKRQMAVLEHPQLRGCVVYSLDDSLRVAVIACRTEGRSSGLIRTYQQLLSSPAMLETQLGWNVVLVKGVAAEELAFRGLRRVQAFEAWSNEPDSLPVLYARAEDLEAMGSAQDEAERRIDEALDRHRSARARARD